MKEKNTFYVIGLMSGSSLDGLDISHVKFVFDNQNFSYTLLDAECIEYSNEFRERLRNASSLSAFEFARLHTELGRYFGKLTNEFIQKYKIENTSLIVSHGQTVFHQPNSGFTSQIGCGAQIAARTHCKVICDLRSADLAHNGQGAPIVPIAEKYLFPEYKIFLNIGGIANIAFHHEEKIIAYDVCAANTVLNYLARQKGLDYDKDGKLARSGNVIPDLLLALNEIDFCKQTAPKSLGSEHIYEHWIPLFDKYDETIEDKLATAVEHIAIQIGNSIKSQIPNLNSQILITGGGALNCFLAERIELNSNINIVIPDTLTVQYKEALAMAFIGLLRFLEIPNCLTSVTGADKDVIGGAIYLP